MQCHSVKAALLAVLSVAAGVGSLTQSSAQLQTSSRPYEGREPPRFLSQPWVPSESRESVARWLDRSRACLAALPLGSCSRVSLEVVVQLARVSFVAQSRRDPDPLESCQSLIRLLEKHGFSVTLEPRCCSAETSAPQRRSASSHDDSDQNDRP